MSLSYQINIRIIFLALIILTLGFAATIWQARHAVNNEIDASVKLTAQIIACGFTQQPDNKKWLECFGSLDETRHLNIELLKPSGEAVNFAKQNSTFPQDNLPPQWFIRLLGSRQTLIQKELTISSGEPLTLKIQAKPTDEIKEIWEESTGYFATFILLTLLTLLSVYGVLHKSIRSINSIVTALQRIETGDYQQIIPEFTTTEYNSIAKAINHMTGELARSQQENRALTQHSLEILETERKQLAQELHDELGQSLTAIKLMALTAGRKPSEVTSISQAITNQCDHLIHVIRSMMRQLHPLVLSELGLKAALEDLVALWSGRHTELEVKLDCAEAIDKLNELVSIQLFRVIQECLTNIVRHAGASEALISLKLDAAQPSRVNLCVQDNGKACQPEDLKRGFGVLAMQERILSLGGHFTIETPLGAGVKINASIPI